MVVFEFGEGVQVRKDQIRKLKNTFPKNIRKNKGVILS